MKLYFSETPNPQKACAVAKQLNVPVEFVRIDLSKGEHKHPDFLAVNPNGKTPALQDGETRLWEAHAIMAYLAHKSGSDMWPDDPEEQIDVLKWLNWDTAHFSRHAGRLWFQRFLKPLMGAGDPDEAEIKEATAFFLQFAAVLEDHLSDREYVACDRLTIADFGVGTFMPRSQEAGLPMEEFPNINRWSDTLNGLEAWRNPWPN